MEIEEILENLGYSLRPDGFNFWRALPIYRESGNPNSLRINRQNGFFQDFSSGQSGSFQDLIKLTTGIKDNSKIKEYLNSKGYSEQKSLNIVPKIKLPEFWNKEILNRLVKDHTYWINRGISNETCNDFEGGIPLTGKMENRYLIPVFDDINKDKIIGLVGRDLTEKSPIKYKILGQRSNFCYPLHKNKEWIENTKQVILVESPACIFKLWDFNIKNTLCLFGVNLSDKLLCKLIGLNLNKIIIATNNDTDENGFVGQKSAHEIKLKLNKYFNPDKIEIKLPFGGKDFAEMSKEQIENWIKMYQGVAIKDGLNVN